MRWGVVPCVIREGEVSEEPGEEREIGKGRPKEKYGKVWNRSRGKVGEGGKRT